MRMRLAGARGARKFEARPFGEFPEGSKQVFVLALS